MARHQSHCTWLLAMTLLVVPAAQADDYRRSYLDGVKAIERGQWNEAARLLTAAIAERPEEQARARLVGAIPQPYLPHHYLGVAYFNQQQCERALAEWAISERQGAIHSQSALAEEARAGRTACEAKAKAEAEAVAAREPEAATRAASEDEEARREPEPEPAPAPTAAPPVEEPAETAPSPPAEEPPATAPAPTPSPERGPLPASLLTGVQAFFDGDYRRAVELLERPAPGAPDRVRFYAALFRAAARHALFLLSGEEEADLFAAAVLDLREARRLNPSFAPHPDAFSPRFVELFRDNP